MSLAVEHGSSRSSRWLRDHRLKLAIWIAVAEGVLVAFGAVAWWLALLVAAAVLAFYIWFGRSSPSATLRQTTWIAAASQVLVALVPLLVIVVGTLALIAVGVLVVLALVLLLADRR